MRSSVAVIAALAGIVAATPAPIVARQLPDFDAIDSAPTPSLVGPPLDVTNQTNVYNPTTAVEQASTVVTDVTTPTSSAAAGKFKRGWPSSTTSSTAKSSSSVTPSSSINTISSTTTTSSSTACPTTPEEGTYCGFINPEDACAPQPDGYGPKVTPDTVDAFMNYAPFHKDAQNAATPKGYKNVFKDLNASTSANSYLGLHTLTSYSTSDCSAWCDNTTLCTAFNIYIERDPSLNPTRQDDGTPNPNNLTDTNCPNPSSITNYKCTLWGSSIDNTTATNQGGYRDDFQVVIVGSNGYDKTNETTPVTPPSYNPPTGCGGSAINKPGNNIGSAFFPGPFDVSVCAAYANAQTKFNKANKGSSSTYQPANMFNAYCIKKNNKPLGTYCSLFNSIVDKNSATYTGSKSGSDWYSLESSWTFSLTQQLTGKEK